jgi:rubrerythrin
METAEGESLTALEALGIAIRAETDASELYRDLAQRCDQPALRRRFELLAADEEWHRQFLQDKWKELAAEVELKLPPSLLPRGLATREERCGRSLLEVIDLAIAEERHSRDFYVRAARTSEDPSGQSMFRFLADLEYRHWMELAQERDLLVSYPNYGRPGTEPWRAEASLTSGERKGR